MTEYGPIFDSYMTIGMSILLVYILIVIIVEYSGIAEKMKKRNRMALHVILVVSFIIMMVGMMILGNALGVLVPEPIVIDPVAISTTWTQMAMFIFIGVTLPLFVFALYVWTHK